MLTEKRIVITGAGGTFGQLGSVMFAQEGAKIIAVDMNAEGEFNDQFVCVE